MSARARRIREPIQVYLTSTERAALDHMARELGVSRAEVLRRGLKVIGAQGARSFHSAFDALVGAVSSLDTPDDLAERHDDYLADDRKRQRGKSRRRSSSTPRPG